MASSRRDLPLTSAADTLGNPALRDRDRPWPSAPHPSFILRVTKPGTPAIEHSLTLNIVGKTVAEETARDLRRQGYDVDYQTHGYSLYQNTAPALEAVKWFF